MGADMRYNTFSFCNPKKINNFVKQRDTHHESNDSRQWFYEQDQKSVLCDSDQCPQPQPEFLTVFPVIKNVEVMYRASLVGVLS